MRKKSLARRLTFLGQNTKQSIMIDLKKQYIETKKAAKRFMEAGMLKEYIAHLDKLRQLQLQLIK